MERPLIVGAGPTGLAAALFAAERGVEVRLVERRESASVHSKALGVNPRTLDLLESSGVTARVRAEGKPMTRIQAWRRGRRLVEIDLSRGIDHPHPHLVLLPQARSEELLAEALAGRGVEIERGVELTALTQPEDAVEATLERGDATETVRCPVVLGADGAGSSVREAMGIDFRGSSFDEPFWLADLPLETDLPADRANGFLLDDGFAIALAFGDGLWRVAGNVEDPVSRLPRVASHGEPVWESEFHISHRVAERFSAGRVHLAGDAAHIHSPVGARGMNLGIEDAFVFATLLAEDRLADYHRLRHPPVKKTVETIEWITRTLRGHSRLSGLLRTFSFVVPLLAPLAARRMRPAVLGLDHPVRVR